MVPALGIIEGFYGPLWSWQERRALVSTLAPYGYRFYWYAPKADRFLRRDWARAHPAHEAEQLASFARWCDQQGVEFGVGLSPWEIFNRFDDSARQTLGRRLDELAALGVRRLAILFDDMNSGTSELAARQAEIMAWVQQRGQFDQLAMCPSYYSDDPVLDRVFGARPEQYLEQLGQALGPEVDVFWTGEEVCSREISAGHIRRVARQLGRPPLLWDNYPVNDGDRMSRHLHLRAFTGRPAALSGLIRGHAINPALQSRLTTVPALTLAMAYQQGEDYCYGQAFLQAATDLLGRPLALKLQADLLSLQDAGLHRLSPERMAQLRSCYEGEADPAAAEILGWLSGTYQVTDEMVQTQ